MTNADRYKCIYHSISIIIITASLYASLIGQPWLTFERYDVVALVVEGNQFQQMPPDRTAAYKK